MAHNRLTFRTLALGQYQANCYIIHIPDRPACYVLDPGDEPDRIEQTMRERGVKPLAIVLTHNHIDHCGAAAPLASRFRIPLMIHRADAQRLHSENNRRLAAAMNLPLPPAADRLLNHGDRIHCGRIDLEVIHTPGHTPGSICLRHDSCLFSGDTLFLGSVGRTDLSGGDSRALMESLDTIRALPADTVIFPGHGEKTSLKQEEEINPFF